MNKAVNVNRLGGMQDKLQSQMITVIRISTKTKLKRKRTVCI